MRIFLVVLTLFLLIFETQAGRVYPSAGIAWVVPGGHSAPELSTFQTQFATASSVKQWELDHADLILGGTQGDLRPGGPYILGYMYNQKLEFTPGSLEMYLRDQVERQGQSYESLFLHFSEDTQLQVEEPGDGRLTPFGRVPSIVGWTERPDHAGFLIYDKAPYDKPAWEHHAQDGGLYVLLFEAFDRLHLDLSSTAANGELVVEYPSASYGGFVTRWSTLEIEDDTENLSRSGEVRWKPPIDWRRVSTHDGSRRTYGGGPYFGKKLLRDGGRYYVVRLMWRNGSGNTPRLRNVQLKDWMPEFYATGSVQVQSTSGSDKSAQSSEAVQLSAPTTQVRMIPGWDVRNDKNGDGYVDDEEFAQLANPHARARFQYESRVVPLGRMWSARSSWCRPNLFNPVLGQLLGAYYKQTWQREGLAGAYNDDLYRLLQNEFTPVSGGQLAEFSGQLVSDATEQAYHQAFINTLSSIRQTSDSILGANISMVNLWSKEGGAQDFIPAFGVFLREGYLRPSLGLSGWFGLNRAWDTFALAAKDRWSILMAMANWGSRVSRQGNTRAAWEKDIESSLAQYYLLNIPGKTYFHMWNQQYQYGSGNTTASNYYQAGIPKNMAYHPAGQLSADIGEPLTYLSSGREPMAYMKKTTVSDYTVIGHSGSTELINPSFPEGSLAVTPANIFYLARSTQEVVPGGPAEAVLAREYTKGLVLFRTDFFGHNETFQQSFSQEILLPGAYRRVNYDGSLGPVITSIVLAGYEGAVLVRVQ